MLKLEGVTKKFGGLVAVNSVDLHVNEGEILGLVGPNGAGKSTTVGMILGLIAPSSGKVELFGHNLHDDMWTSLRRVGAVIEEPAFSPSVPGL
jgi:ABC-2 type transport system ATP-binding protein